jgi:glycosyltransferase involved in cell wall biosynthesis
MKKVLILQEYIPRYRSRFFSDLSTFLRGVEIEVQVAAGATRERQQSRLDSSPDYVATKIRSKEFDFFGNRVLLRDSLRLIFSADYVVYEHARRNWDLYLHILLSKLGILEKPLLWGHGADSVQNVGFFRSSAMKFLAVNSGYYFVYTNGGRKALKAWGLKDSKISTVNNTIDDETLASDLLSAGDVAVREFQEHHGLLGATALFIGAIDESKRMDFLISAAQKAHFINPAFRLIICGSGQWKPRLAAEHKDSAFLIFLDAAFGTDKATLLKACQFIAMPGRVGLVAIDSFVSMRPIVTTSWKYHAPEFEYLESGENSIVCQDTVESYASTMLELLSSPKELARLKQGCSKSAQKYSMNSMVGNFASGLEGHIAAQRAKSSRRAK